MFIMLILFRAVGSNVDRLSSKDEAIHSISTSPNFSLHGFYQRLSEFSLGSNYLHAVHINDNENLNISFVQIK